METLRKRATTDFWTSHIEHRSAGQLVDLFAAWANAPDPFLHELRGAIHTPGYHAPRLTPEQIEELDSAPEDDPEILTNFPFAHDAWNVYWVVGAGNVEGAAAAAWGDD